ncbi:hypothetical protein AB0I55_12715 [Actinocatenispora sera]|jgi:hypothetical protein|uniref:Uncharacterized protein n=1 Tax=Actinocatenispora sera TaxID=390989 RepID=A0A810KWG0_9ACTN|nr:hypothetical protein [Actinocatenispora sera]BCJ27404.1 hypothetical protein Asera_15120 [Actinocatenispora sera]
MTSKRTTSNDSPDERRRPDDQERRIAEATIRAMSAPSVGATAVRMAAIVSSLR